MSKILTEHEREILECIVDGWADSDFPLIGRACYNDVVKLLDKLGANTERVHTMISEFDPEYRKSV